MHGFRLPFSESGPQALNRRPGDFPSGHPAERYSQNAASSRYGMLPRAPIGDMVEMPDPPNEPPDSPPTTQD